MICTITFLCCSTFNAANPSRTDRRRFGENGAKRIFFKRRKSNFEEEDLDCNIVDSARGMVLTVVEGRESAVVPGQDRITGLKNEKVTLTARTDDKPEE